MNDSAKNMSSAVSYRNTLKNKYLLNLVRITNIFFIYFCCFKLHFYNQLAMLSQPKLFVSLLYQTPNYLFFNPVKKITTAYFRTTFLKFSIDRFFSFYLFLIKLVFKYPTVHQNRSSVSFMRLNFDDKILYFARLMIYSHNTNFEL